MRRPVPLEHNLYYSGELYPIFSPKDVFLTEGVRKATAAHKKKKSSDTPFGAGAKAGLPTGRPPAQGPNSGRGRGGGQAGRGGGAGANKPSSSDLARRHIQGARLAICKLI